MYCVMCNAHILIFITSFNPSGMDEIGDVHLAKGENANIFIC